MKRACSLRPFYLLTLGLAFFFSCAAQATEAPGPSLFFSPQAVRRIDALNHGATAQEGRPARKAMRLDSLLYTGPESWTFWLGGETWRPGTARPPLHVVEVTADSVRFSIDGSGGKPAREVILHPSQSLSLAGGE